jgi:putative transposase
MPRIVRGLGDNIVYHVIKRGNGRQEVFHSDKDYEAFMKLMKEAKERYPVRLYGYCLMPNHSHMAVTPGKGEELSRWMQGKEERRKRKGKGEKGTVLIT